MLKYMILCIICIGLLTSQTITQSEWQNYLNETKDNSKKILKMQLNLVNAGRTISTGRDLLILGLCCQIADGLLFGISGSDGTFDETESWMLYTGSISIGLGVILQTIGLITVGDGGSSLKNIDID